MPGKPLGIEPKASNLSCQCSDHLATCTTTLHVSILNCTCTYTCVHAHMHARTHAEAIIAHLANLDIGDRSGKTALHHAAYNGHLQMLSLLLVKGANVKAADRREKTPLHLAAFMGERSVGERGGDRRRRKMGRRRRDSMLGIEYGISGSRLLETL